jgi:hypothetical protein
MPDCQSSKDLKKLAEIDCFTPTPGYTNNGSVRFSQVYHPNLVLGSSEVISTIVREGKSLTDSNQMHDVLLTYMCGDQWTIHASKEPTVISKDLRD